MPSRSAEQTVRVVIPEDALRADLHVEPDTDPKSVTPEFLLAKLTEAGIEVTQAGRAVNVDLVNRLRAVCEAGGDVTAVNGVSPDHGSAGFLELRAGLDPTADGRRASVVAEAAPAPAPQSGAAAKFHYNRAVFCFVAKGQQLGRIVPPRPGIDGRDVRGRTLACKQSRPADVRTDASLAIAQDGEVTANVDGILCHEPPRLVVRQDIEVAGCIDFATGNLDGPRDVTVGASIREKFTVNARRDLAVGGVVESATISSVRDMVLTGGMASKEAGSLRCGRDCTAKYLNNVSGSIGRDLRLAREMINAQMEIGRSLLAPEATVAGGRIVVGGSVELGTLGSDSGRTELVLGCLPSLTSLLDNARKLTVSVDERVKKAEGRLSQLKSINGKHSHAQAEELTELEFGLAEARGKSVPLAEAVSRLSGTLARLTTVDLIVRECVFARTLLCADNVVVDFHADLKGPMRFSLSGTGGLVVTDLATNETLDIASVAKVTTNPDAILFRAAAENGLPATVPPARAAA